VLNCLDLCICVLHSLYDILHVAFWKHFVFIVARNIILHNGLTILDSIFKFFDSCFTYCRLLQSYAHLNYVHVWIQTQQHIPELVVS
jgi:hypothetical protein